MAKNLPYANKDLGQHFLCDQQVISAITDDIHESTEVILEVGPGPAVLTERLVEHDRPYFLVEKDLRFRERLLEFAKEEHCFFGDGLSLNIEDKFQQWAIDQKKVWLVSNLPYNISVPLTLKFLNVENVATMTLMYQREVAERILSTNLKKVKMGSLMVLMQTYFEVSLLKKVPPGAFIPPPKVDSSVLSFNRLSSPVIPLTEFKPLESFLRSLFLHKRKQIGSLLKAHYQAEEIDQALAAIQSCRTDRAEALELEQIQQLYCILKK